MRSGPKDFKFTDFVHIKIIYMMERCASEKKNA